MSTEITEVQIDGYRIKRTKIYSFREVNYNSFFRDNIVVDDFNEIKNFYEVEAKYKIDPSLIGAYRRYELSELPNIQIKLSFVHADINVDKVLRKNEISYFINIPGYGIQIDRITAIDDHFYIIGKDLKNFKLAWISKFGPNTFKFIKPNLKEIRNLVNEKKRLLMITQSFSKNSHLLFKNISEINLKKIEVNDNKIQKLNLSSDIFNQLIVDINAVPNSVVNKAKANALKIEYGKILIDLNKLKIIHHRLLNESIKKLSLTFMSSKDLPHIEEINKIDKDYNQNDDQLFENKFDELLTDRDKTDILKRNQTEISVVTESKIKKNVIEKLEKRINHIENFVDNSTQQNGIRSNNKTDLFNGKKFPLFAIDVNNLYISLRQKYERLTRNNPLKKMKKIYFNEPPYLAYFFATKQLEPLLNEFPKNEFHNFYIENEIKNFQNGKFIDIDITLTLKITEILTRFSEQISHFYLAASDKEYHTLIKLFQSYNIPVTIIAIDKQFISKMMIDLVDSNVVYLY